MTDTNDHQTRVAGSKDGQINTESSIQEQGVRVAVFPGAHVFPLPFTPTNIATHFLNSLKNTFQDSSHPWVDPTDALRDLKQVFKASLQMLAPGR
jgi:alpha-ketoglutarate-dependent taurine dioxygenase